MQHIFASLVLLLSQLPGAFAAVGTATLVLVTGLGFLAARVRRLSFSRLIVVASAVGAIQFVFLAQTYSDLGTRWITVAQLCTFFIVANGVASNPGYRLLTRMAFCILSVNFLFTPTRFTGLSEYFWHELNDTYRYQGYFDEPAEAAIMFSICLAIILSGRWCPRQRSVAIAVYLILVAVSQSLSGILLAVLLIGTAIARKECWPVSANRTRKSFVARALMRSMVVLIATGAVLSAVVGLSGEGYIRNRISNAAEGGNDGSAQLRLLSPLQIAKQVYSDERLILGMGIGGHEQYILDNAGDFPLQVIYTGDEVGHINNGYVAIIAMMGYPIAMIVFGVAAVLIWVRVRSRPPGSPNYYLILLLAIPFVDGRIVSPIYFLIIGLFAAGHSNRDGTARSLSSRDESLSLVSRSGSPFLPG